jgi:sterol desaturase/sphingolipid hydroxylase (fatty acid hydroxylase superfamily)
MTLDTPSSDADTIHPIPFVLRWLTWPTAFAGGIAAVVLAPRFGGDMVAVSGAVSGVLIITLVIMERIWPAARKWDMTWRSFARDIQFFLVNGVTIAATNTLFAWIGVAAAQGHGGLLANWSVWLAVPAGMLVVDFLQYWQHRISHEANGPMGRFLWRSHAAHHLPEQVYVLMHPAGHPINTFIVRGLVTILPLYLLGLTPEAVVLTNLAIGVQGIISHSNLDLRAGWLNYIFVGPELHRYHHSADSREAGNYATALSILDVLFGTFVYKPGQLPVRLGVDDPTLYPRSGQVWKILLLPFAPTIGRVRKEPQNRAE